MQRVTFGPFFTAIATTQPRCGQLLPLGFGLVGSLLCPLAISLSRFCLRLTPEGFSYGTVRRHYVYKWSDIVTIGVTRVGEKKVCFTFRNDYRSEERLRAINQASFGFDRFLPDTYGGKPVELAELLCEWRQRYTQADTARN